MKSLAEHEAWFRAYFEKERLLEQEDAAPMDLKLDHTMRVLANAQNIVEREAFSPIVCRCCLLAALYHDIARFEQYLRYRTFKDRVSINHGRFGVQLIKETGCLCGESRVVRHTVMSAVGLHNRFSLPRALPADIATVTRVTRDADKLDILRVIDAHLQIKPYNPTVILQLPDTLELSSNVVIEAALHDSVASYSDLQSVNDFRLLLATWINDMTFASSREAFIQQGHAYNILLGLPDEGVYAKAKAHMLRRLSV